MKADENTMERLRRSELVKEARAAGLAVKIEADKGGEVIISETALTRNGPLDKAGKKEIAEKVEGVIRKVYGGRLVKPVAVLEDPVRYPSGRLTYCNAAVCVFFASEVM